MSWNLDKGIKKLLKKNFQTGEKQKFPKEGFQTVTALVISNSNQILLYFYWKQKDNEVISFKIPSSVSRTQKSILIGKVTAFLGKHNYFPNTQ